MKKALNFTTREITEIAILCALAIVFDTYVKIPVGATGGSINFSMLPLIIICLRHGPFKGFISAAFIYGIITCWLDDYGFQFYPMEYFIAFGSIAITGFTANYVNKKHGTAKSKAFSIVLLFFALTTWAVIRFFANSIDSVIFYDLDFPGAFAYNAPSVFISYIFDFALTILLLPVVIRLNRRFKTPYLKLEDAPKQDDTITINVISNSKYETTIEFKIHK